ncbi:MAG TPA: hypothetical protein VLJ88_07595 [Propionibacteriaceae bacterium]|nr:hypothetical protein [Propionibacteriaceae bacterium]
MLSTLAYLVLYLGLREVTGPQLANLGALVITAVCQHRGQPAADLRRPQLRFRSLRQLMGRHRAAE